MRLFGLIGAGALSLLLGTSTAAFAQQDKEQEVRPPQQEEPKAEPKHEEAKPRKEEGRPPKQDEMKPPKHEDQKSQHGQERPEAGEHARPAGKSARIPDDKFRSHFGREHTVVINRPVIVEGRPRFQSSGYWFEIVDPWPVGWAYTDECYVDYVDGEYFLFDVLHPGVRIALFVTM